MTQPWNRYLSACGIAIALGTIGFSATLPAIASTLLPESQPSQAVTRDKSKQGGDKIRELNLTDAQKQQVRTIRRDMHQKIDAVLTNEQRAKILQARQSRQNPQAVMKSIQLTALQKQKIRAIQQNSYQQIGAILTAEQRAKLEQMRPKRLSNLGT